MRLIRSRIVLTQVGPVIEDGAVLIKEGKILSVGRYRDLCNLTVSENLDLEESILMPGLINAHCHLDYSGMRYQIAPEKSFSEWIKKIIVLKTSCSIDQFHAAIAEGLKELRSWGTTSVLNIQASLGSLNQLRCPHLRVWWCQEMIDARSSVLTEEIVKDLLDFLKRNSWLGGVGLSPHAPYTVSDKLYRSIKLEAEKYGLLVTTHLSESMEELEMFQAGSGALFEFLEHAGCTLRNFRGKSPFTLLVENELLCRGSLLVHMNFLSNSDWDILRNQASDYTIVHCPKTHNYFQREKFHFQELREAGVSVCLGTDSLASNSSLNLFEEMRLFLSTHAVTQQEVLNMVTLYPARAFGWEGRLGIIAPGACADLIALPYSERLDRALEAVIHNDKHISWVMVGGRQIGDC